MTFKINVNFEIQHDGAHEPPPLSEEALKAVWAAIPLTHAKFGRIRELIQVVQIRFQHTYGDCPRRELICLKFILAKQEGEREHSEYLRMLVCEFTRKAFRRELGKVATDIAATFERQADSHTCIAASRTELAERVRKL